MTLEQHIQQIFNQTYAGCDTAVLDANPRAYGLEWVKVGFMEGIKAGQQMRSEADDLAAAAKTQKDFNRGYAQGLSYAVWVATNNTQMLEAEDPGYQALLGALEAAREAARMKVVA